MDHSFKQAANAIALFYKDALAQNKQAHQEGYLQCLQDLVFFISSSSKSQLSLQELEAFINTKLAEIHHNSPAIVQTIPPVMDSVEVATPGVLTESFTTPHTDLKRRQESNSRSMDTSSLTDTPSKKQRLHQNHHRYQESE
jgi:hypothetical protein